MKKNILILFLFIIQTATFSQNWEWGIKATGNSQYSDDTEIAVDGEGNIVFAGYYKQELSFDTLSIYSDDDNYSDIYLCRIDSAHKVQWLKHIETNGHTYGDAIGLCLDDDKNIYLTGRKNSKAFVAKYAFNGDLIWETELGDTSGINYSGYGYSVGTDMYDNIYITGGSGPVIFFAKLDFFGNTVWYKEIEDIYLTSNAYYGNDIAVDKNGDVYFTGVFNVDSISFDNIVLYNNLSWGPQTFYGKIDTNGNFIWAKNVIGRTNESPQIVLTADNKIYLAGVYYYYITIDNFTVNFNSGSNDPKPFIAKLETDGNVLWAKAGNTTYDNKGSTKNIKTDYTGNLYLTGFYSTGTYRYTDYYIEKYNSNGDVLWRKEFIMYTTDYSHSIDIDNNGFCYNVGYNKSGNFIDTANIVSLYTVGIGQLNTQSSTYKKTPRPKIDRIFNICEEDSTTLFAEGEQIKWYTSPELTDFIHEGNEFKTNITSSIKFYVTQTINGIESWPKEIIITLSELSFANIEISGDTIFALTEILNHSYEWFYNDELIPYENRYFYLPDTSGYYSVIISDGYCQKQLDTLFEKTVVDTLKEAEVLLYPNPTNQKATIIIKSELNNELELTLISYNGRTYFRKKIYKEGLYFNYNIDLSLYPTGIYLLNISGNNLNITKKLIRN